MNATHSDELLPAPRQQAFNETTGGPFAKSRRVVWLLVAATMVSDGARPFFVQYLASNFQEDRIDRL